MTSIRTIQIHPDGTVDDVTIPEADHGNTICKAIDCDLFDVVSLEDGIDLFVDDEGIIARKPLNICATVIAHQLGAGAVLFGTVVAVSVDAGGNTVGLNAHQVSPVHAAMSVRPDAATVEKLAESLAPFPGVVRLVRAVKPGLPWPPMAGRRGDSPHTPPISLCTQTASIQSDITLHSL